MKYAIKLDVKVLRSGIQGVIGDREKQVLNLSIEHDAKSELSDSEIKEILINVIKSFKALDQIKEESETMKTN